MSDKLAKIIQSDPDMVRRASDIEVDEVTLTKKGALGDQADAVILFKEEGEKSDDTKEDEAVELEKKSDDSYKPTSGMVSEAKQGLEWRSEHGRGGTEVGIARARDISSGKELPLETVKRMHSFFSRHAVDKKGKGFTPGDGYPSNGRIAWALWGGDAGASWAAKIAGKETTEEASKSEAKLEKEEVAEDARDGDIEMDFDSAVSFIRKSELTEEQRTSLVDMALELNWPVDLEKDESEASDTFTVEPCSGMVFSIDQKLTKEQSNELWAEIKKQHEVASKTGAPMVVHSGMKLEKQALFPPKAMEMLKSISEAVSKLSPVAIPETATEETVEIVKSEETTETKAPEPSLAESVGARLLKAQEERLAQGRAEQDASLLNAVSSLSASLEAVTQKLEASGRKLNRACGQDA